jgi:hypothetical protein
MVTTLMDGLFESVADMFSTEPAFWRHDIQHNETQHNDIQHNDTQHNDIQHNDTQHNDTQHYNNVPLS